MDELMMTILFASLVSSILIILFGRRRSFVKDSGSHLPPPGRMGLPILGESIEFIRSMRKGRPESFVQDRIRRYSSETFRTSLLGDAVTFMYGPAGNKFLFANEGKVVNVWWPKQVDELIPISNSDKFMAKHIDYSLFKPVGLQKHFDTIDRMAKLHLEANWQGHQQVNVHSLTENYTFSLACQLFLSIKDDETIQSLAVPMISLKHGIASLRINLPWTKFGRAMRASRLITERLRPIIRIRTALHLSSNDEHDDLISHMLRTTNDSGENMNEDEVIYWLIAYLLAGHDSSAATITLIFNFLSDREDIYDKVLQEQLDVAESKEPGELLNFEDMSRMKYSWDVAREVMRLYPPAAAIHRIATDDFVYDGHCISKGSIIQMNIVSTHRDPILFPKPHNFDPSRFEGDGPMPYTYFPFGGGPRICPGNNYARVVILVFLHNIITRYRWEKLHVNEPIIYGINPKPVYGLPIHLHPHPWGGVPKVE